MKSVTCTNAKLEVVDQPTPTPAKGQLLIDVTAAAASADRTCMRATTATNSPT